MSSAPPQIFAPLDFKIQNPLKYFQLDVFKYDPMNGLNLLKARLECEYMLIFPPGKQ